MYGSQNARIPSLFQGRLLSEEYSWRSLQRRFSYFQAKNAYTREKGIRLSISKPTVAKDDLIDFLLSRGLDLM